MKRILFLILLLLPVWASAQVTTRQVRYQTGAPTGTCSEIIVIDRVTGRAYDCVSGTWTVVGGVTSVTGTANQITVTGTTTPVLSIPSDFRAPGTLTVAGTTTITSSSATCFVVGPNGTTNPVITVDCSVASQADGISIKGNAAGSGVTFTATSSGSNAGINLTPKGTGGLLFTTDNTWDIGASGANRPRNIFIAGVVRTGSIDFGNSAGSITQSAGILQLGAGTTTAVTLASGATNAFLQFGGTTSSFPALKRSSTGLITRLADDSADAPFAASTLSPSSPAITVGSGTGITVNNTGEVRTTTYKVTVINTALSAAATTADVTIATLPAATQLNGIWADVTQVFTGGAVATATMVCGKTAGGAEYLASFNVFTATIRRGLADADLGTAMVRSAAIQGGDMPSFTATTAVQCRITTTGANTSALNQGSVTFYLRTTKLP